MTIAQTVEIPASHRLTIEVPQEVPAGKTILTFTPASEKGDLRPAPTAPDGNGIVGECPLDHTPNAETIATFEEVEAMKRGEIPMQRFNSLEELLADLRS
jgi:hypothetical protein